MIPFCCKWCNARIGDTTTSELIMGGGIIRKHITITCLICKRQTKWAKAITPLVSDKAQSSKPLSHEDEVRLIIQNSMNNPARTSSFGMAITPPRRDAIIDADEVEADRSYCEKMDQLENELDKAENVVKKVS